MRKFVIGAALCAMASAAQADPYPMDNPTGYDPYAADAIARADYAVAEERLMRRLDHNSNDVSALLNLAAVMTETSRVARASSLLEQVMGADNVLLEDSTGAPLWSHDIAAASLRGRVTLGSAQ